MKTGEESFLVESNDGVRFVVKKEFLNVCKDPQGMSRYQLVGEFLIADYMHNTHDYAIAMKENDIWVPKEIWLNGERVADEVGLKMLHSAKFNDKLIEKLD